MESGDLPLERALELFEKGMQLSETCRKQLEEAETRIEMLIRKGDKIQAEPFRPDPLRQDKAGRGANTSRGNRRVSTKHWSVGFHPLRPYPSPSTKPCDTACSRV